MLTALNFLNRSGKMKKKKMKDDEKITLSIKWNIMSIVHGTP